MKSGKHQRSKQRCQDYFYAEGSQLCTIFFLFCTHTLCMSYVIKTFLLVGSLVRSKQLLCFMQGQGQKSEQKHTTKNLIEFHNHSPLLTMIMWKQFLQFSDLNWMIFKWWKLQLSSDVLILIAGQTITLESWVQACCIMLEAPFWPSRLRWTQKNNEN